MSSPWDVDRARLGWWLLGTALGAVVLFVVTSFVGTFVFGLFMYYATRPLYRRLGRRIKPPSLAAAVSLLGIALPAILLLSYTVAIGIQELTRFANRTDLEELETLVGPYIDISRIPKTPDELLAGGGLDAFGDVLGSASTYIGVLGIGALHLFVMIAIAFYLLRDDHRLSRWVRRRFGDRDGVLETYLDAVDHSFNQVFFGNIMNAALTGTIGALVYNLLDFFGPAAIPIPYATLLGLLAGVASLVPIVGMKLVYVPATAYLLALALVSGQSDLLWFPVAFAVLSFVVVDTIPDLVLRPYVSGRELHIGMLMLAYIFGPLLFGWYGIFLAPMLLVLIVHFARLVLPELVAGVPIRPAAIDPTNLTEPESIEPSLGNDLGSDADPAGDDDVESDAPPEPSGSDPPGSPSGADPSGGTSGSDRSGSTSGTDPAGSG